MIPRAILSGLNFLMLLLVLTTSTKSKVTPSKSSLRKPHFKKPTTTTMNYTLRKPAHPI
jgi:hypothetical protein